MYFITNIFQIYFVGILHELNFYALRNNQVIANCTLYIFAFYDLVADDLKISPNNLSGVDRSRRVSSVCSVLEALRCSSKMGIESRQRYSGGIY